MNTRRKLGRVTRFRAETDQASRWLSYALLEAEKGLPPDLGAFVLTRTDRGPSHDHQPIPRKTVFIPPDFAYGKVRRDELLASSTPTTYVFTRETIKSFNNESDIPSEDPGDLQILVDGPTDAAAKAK